MQATDLVYRITLNYTNLGYFNPTNSVFYERDSSGLGSN